MRKPRDESLSRRRRKKGQLLAFYLGSDGGESVVKERSGRGDGGSRSRGRGVRKKKMREGGVELVEEEAGRRERPGSTERGNKVRRQQPPAGLVFTARLLFMEEVIL